MKTRISRTLLVIVALTTLNAAYLAAFDSATIFYHVNVLLHVVLGGALTICLLAVMVGHLVRLRRPSRESADPAAGWTWIRSIQAVAAAVMVLTGVYLAFVGTYAPYRKVLWLHEAGALVFVLALAVLLTAGRKVPRALAFGTWAAVALLVAFPVAVRLAATVRPAHVTKITNPPLPPVSPDDEGLGASSPFFPSSNRTASGALIRSDFFLESKSCGNVGCHPDITAQWESSAHHFSSFNNQWYRKSIEYMQDTIGTRPSKWCGGCHDMAILLTGRMDTPIREQIHTPEAQAGIGCLVCHSIVHVHDTMGQGGFTLEYPEMHRLVASKNPILEFLHDRMVLLDPGPHKATMLKPFHRTSTPEFCSSCHKVHLDIPVNHYRWFRGFNDYDAWQQSGISGQGARAFYYPADGPKKCGSCHMPLVPSTDMGNINGMVHSHRFPGANTALPFQNEDAVQLDAVTKFLQDGILTLDIFAVSEEEEGPEGSAESASIPTLAHGGGASNAEDIPAQAQSMMPEESGLGGGVRPTLVRSRRIVAPLGREPAGVRAGTTVRVDVVARTRKIGHFFPGGTADAFDVWLELRAEDAKGRVLFWNGWVADEGKGPVDPGAHFYRALLLDDHGNRINKRNAWSARAAAYVRLIPPGAADTAHFRLAVPADVEGPITLTARMNHRKFAWWNTQWAFAGVRDPAQPSYAISKRYDDGPWVFTGDTSDVSGPRRAIPDLPITVVAKDVKTLSVVSSPSSPPPVAKDRERWNDYGIGLLLQRDLAGAAEAFETVTRIEPKYADGWVNRARVAIEEGDHREALELVGKALELEPTLPKARYFRALALRTLGRYDQAAEDLHGVIGTYPRDRVVWNALGRVRFLQRRFQDAVDAFKNTLSIDPEDVTAHYNLMLSYRGLGNAQASKLHESFYARFKADESAQSVTGTFRLLNAYDNRERQPIHAHDSTWTPENLAAASGPRYNREIQRTPVAAPLSVGLEDGPSSWGGSPVPPLAAEKAGVALRSNTRRASDQAERDTKIVDPSSAQPSSTPSASAGEARPR